MSTSTAEEKLVSGNFYNSNVDSDFTVFNWCFIEDYPKIINFFDKLSNVFLPNYIERLSSGKINENDFSYNYFIENPKEPIHHKSICFTINDFETIYNIIKRNENKFFDKNITPQNEDLKIFGITYKKLQQEIYQEIIKNLKKNDNEKISFRHGGSGAADHDGRGNEFLQRQETGRAGSE